MKLTTNTFTKKLTFWGPPQAFFLWYLRWISIPFLVFSKVSKPRFCQNTPKNFSPAAGFFGYLRSGMQRFSNPLQQLLFLQSRFVNTDTLIAKVLHILRISVNFWFWAPVEILRLSGFARGVSTLVGLAQGSIIIMIPLTVGMLIQKITILYDTLPSAT